MTNKHWRCVFTQEQLDEMVKMHNEGLLAPQIANKFDVSCSTILRNLRNCGIYGTMTPEWKKYTDKVIDLYVNQKKSVSEIMQIMNLSCSRVRGILYSNNAMRSVQEAVQLCHDLHPEVKEKIRNTLVGTHRPEDVKEKISKNRTGILHTPATKAQMSKSHTGVKLSPQHIHNLVLASVAASHKRPNRGEIALGKIVDKVSPDFRYNGGCELGVVIGGRVPDFVNVNGQKKVILYNGCYWHGCPICFPNRTDSEAERNNISAYTSLGWKVLTVWEHEMQDMNNVSANIKSFIGG